MPAVGFPFNVTMPETGARFPSEPQPPKSTKRAPPIEMDRSIVSYWLVTGRTSDGENWLARVRAWPAGVIQMSDQVLVIACNRLAVADRAQRGHHEIHVDVFRDRPHRAVSVCEVERAARVETPPRPLALVVVLWGRRCRADIKVGNERSGLPNCHVREIVRRVSKRPQRPAINRTLGGRILAKH